MTNGNNEVAAPLVTDAIIIATIKAGQSVSAAVACTNGVVTRIWMPISGWDGGLVTFQLSYDNVTYYDLFDSDNREMSYNMTVGALVYTKPTFPVASTMWIKVRSGTRAAPKIQTADRNFKIDIVV